MGCDNLGRSAIRFIEKTKGAYALVGLTSDRGANSKRERDGKISNYDRVADANRARATERKRENKRQHHSHRVCVGFVWAEYDTFSDAIDEAIGLYNEINERI